MAQPVQRAFHTVHLSMSLQQRRRQRALLQQGAPGWQRLVGRALMRLALQEHATCKMAHVPRDTHQVDSSSSGGSTPQRHTTKAAAAAAACPHTAWTRWGGGACSAQLRLRQAAHTSLGVRPATPDKHRHVRVTLCSTEKLLCVCPLVSPACLPFPLASQTPHY